MFARALSACVLVLAAAAAHAQFNCPAWTVPSTADGPNASVNALLVHDNKLIVSGQFSSVGGLPCFGFAQYDGSAWTPMNAGLTSLFAGGRTTVASWGGRLYACGPSSQGSLGRIWTGSTWIDWPAAGTSGPAGSRPDVVFALGDGKLLAGGYFVFPSDHPSGVSFRRVAYFNGSSWSMPSTTQYGPSVNQNDSFNYIRFALTFEGKTLIFGPPNISTGDRWNTAIVPCNNGACTFDGSSFAPFPAPALNNSIACAVVFQDELYVSGNFTATADNSMTLNHLAKYSDGAWHKVGSGISRAADYMVVADDGSGEKLHLFMTGTATTTAYNDPNSTTTDTVQFRGVVRYSGTRFSAYGLALANGYSTNSTYAAASYDPGTGPALYVGGNGFNPNNLGPTNFARWGPASGPDTDGDGIPDAWEQNGIDVNCDGVIDLNLPAMGANWRHKDVFVEVDSMEGRAPTQYTLDRVIAAFAAAPNSLVDNPDGLDGVTLHLIVDPEDQTIPLSDFVNTWPDFHHIKNHRFCNAADRTGPNQQAIYDAKRRVFRYCIFGNTFGGTLFSGNSEAPGNDFMVTLGSFTTPGGTSDEQAGTFMHELGHTLGLWHGGSEDQKTTQFNFKPNYHSVMNYAWQLSSAMPGWTLDYSRRALPDLDEHALNEPAGIGGEPGALIAVGPPPAHRVEEFGPVDWNDNGSLEGSVVADINRCLESLPASLDVLKGFEDWSHLKYNFRNTPGYASGNSPESEPETMTQALADAINALAPPASCLADLGSAGGVPGADGVLNNNDFIAFITHFFNADARADLGIAGGLPGHDGQFNNNDFIAFISLFFEGCG